jgi:hypothetical protein
VGYKVEEEKGSVIYTFGIKGGQLPCPRRLAFGCSLLYRRWKATSSIPFGNDGYYQRIGLGRYGRRMLLKGEYLTGVKGNATCCIPLYSLDSSTKGLLKGLG